MIDDGPGLRFDTPSQRLAGWHYVLESLIGGLSDEGILKWLEVHGPSLEVMVRDAMRLRDGMIAT